MFVKSGIAIMASHDPKTQPTSPSSDRRLGKRLRCVAVGIGAWCLVAMGPPLGHAQSGKVNPFSTAPEAGKINLNLLQLDAQAQRRYLSLGQAARTRAVATVGDGVQVDILTSRLDADVEARIVQTGARVLHASVGHRRLSVVVDHTAILYALARIPEVEMISPEYGAIVNTGAVDGRASEAMMADMAKLASSLDGSGQTIGILSDSFARSSKVRDATTTPAAGVAGTLRSSQPQRSGDLPATLNLRRDDIAGSDEGAAMAELVHDVAPGADIAFYSAFAGQAAFADGITDLCTTAGSTVVVDDVIYFAEPMYQDGIIAQAAADCVASGVPYFSSAGNGANRGFRQLFSDIATLDDTVDPPSGNDLHDWGNGDGFLDVTLPVGGSIRVVLQWNQPFNSVSPGQGAEIDLDLFITRTPGAAGLSSPLASGIAVQGTTGAPRGDAVEIAFYQNLNAAPVTVYIAVEHFQGSQQMIPQDATTPLEFRLVFFENNAAATTIQGINDGTSAFGGPTMYGHAVADGVVSVGAVPWYDTAVFDPSFGVTGVADPERFSSRGGLISVLFDRHGAFSPRTSFEPDLSAVDGNNTTFFGSHLDLGGFEGEPDGFPNFFGTSAAAPNAAAVAALMLEFNGTLTPAQLTTALVDTAVDITGFRAAPGWDDVTGAGLIDANAAIGAIMQEPNGVINTPNGNVTITQGESLNFTATGAGTAANYPLTFWWNFGGGAADATAEDPGRVTFDTIGTFTVTFTVTDSQGGSDPTPATLIVTVSAPRNGGGGGGDDDGGGGGGGVNSGGGGGGGGCTLNPDASGDFTLLLACGGILAYLGWKRRRQLSHC